MWIGCRETLQEQAHIRTADNRRRSPPDQNDHRGKKRNLPLGKSDLASFGARIFRSQNPPPPLSSLLQMHLCRTVECITSGLSLF